uniref:hypothetical protein n=1 Tax=Flavobacterium sp. TaxID=239 RepID=UPI00404854FC
MTDKIKFKIPYTKTKRCFFETTGPSLTQQHFKEETLINNIIKKHDKNGIIESVARGNARYGDFSLVQDYKTSLDTIRDANDNFMEIPSEIRKKFNNNAGEFFNFVQDPNNQSELIKMGLATASTTLESATPVADKPSSEVPSDDGHTATT